MVKLNKMIQLFLQLSETFKNKTVLIRDSSTISLCLGLFSWGKFRMNVIYYNNKSSFNKQRCET